MRGLRPTAAVLAAISTATPVLAAVDFQKCCTQVPVSAELRPHQWDACHSYYNESEKDPAKMWAPPIKTTYSWCREHCEASGNFQVSDTSQWLPPLAAWIIPTSALLLLLPVSEHLKTDEQNSRQTGREKFWNKYFGNWLHPVVEYVQILGDPASAFNGALSQMIADWALCLSMYKPNNGRRERDLILIVMLVDQANFDSKPVRGALDRMARSGEVRIYTRIAGRVIWSARKKFNTSVALPVAFYIGVAAAVFYDACLRLGNNDTAYGIWYSWILLLAVFANCFASHSNLEAVRSGLEIIIFGPTAPFSGNLECKGVPLHKRYRNTNDWVRWLDRSGVDLAAEGIWSYNPFWPNWYSNRYPKIMYALAQILAWLFVLFSCSCAAVPFTTPKVGVGCRSLNHILYISIALLVALLRVVKDSLSDHPGFYKLVTAIYHTFGTLNAVLILIGGSLMQITGVLRNCRCMANLARAPDTVIVLSQNTYEHQYWARVVWLRVAYLALGGVVGLSVCALLVRMYITRTVRRALSGF